MSESKIRYTKKRVPTLIMRAVEGLRQVPKNNPLDLNYSESFLPLDEVDMDTLREITKSFTSVNYRVEIGVVFKNSENIKTDTVFIEVYEKE
jgi:hypothetical protein